MDVAVITVGDELLAGETENTNATWLADRLTSRGASVRRVVVLPDDRAVLVAHIRRYSEEMDATIVTGGIGSTPDDVTMEAVAAAFDRPLVLDELALEAVRARLATLERQIPELELDIDEQAEASIPEGSRPLLNEEGLAPGCVLETVYVLPGIPGEMRAMFESVAEEFSGESVSEHLYSVEPESHLVPALRECGHRFDGSVGCYPDRDARYNRLKVSGTDPDEVTLAAQWLLGAVDGSKTPVERDWVG